MAKMPQVMVNELERVTQEINAMAPPPKMPREQAEFVTVGNQAADAMVQAAEHALTEGQNLLERVKATADQIKGMIVEREQEIHEYIEKTKALGGEVLNAAKTFLDGEK